MESEERVRAIAREVVLAHRLALPDGSLRPFLPHVAWFLVQATFLQHPQLSRDGNAFKEVVDRCSKMLALKDCPALEIIQLQVNVHANMFMQQMIVAAEEKAFQKRQDDIVHCVLNIKVLDRREDNTMADKLHQLMVEYILEASMGMEEDVSDAALMKYEISTALDSIFPRTGFLYWLHQSDVEKVSQLKELSCVIPGIRAYNRARQKSTIVSEVPYIYFEKEAQDMEKCVEDGLGSVTERIAAYRMALSLHIDSLGVHHVLMQRLRDELHYDLQLFSFLQDLRSVLADVHLIMTKLMDRVKEQLDVLQATIGSQTCVPNELVFPEFRDIGLLQKRASLELRKFRAQSQVVEELLALSVEPKFKRTPVGLASLSSDGGLSKIQIFVDNCGFLPMHLYTTITSQVESGDESAKGSKDESEKVLIIDAKGVQNLKNPRIQLHGYCLMKIVRHGGLLLPGNPEEGLVQVGDKCYAFSTSDDLNEFAKSPKHFLMKLESMAVMMPHLINTLGLQREPKFAHLAISNILELVRPAQLECSTQTSTHILPEHQFDEETYLQRVVELASKRTHSTQTDSTSHFHRDSSSQMWLPRDKSTQSLFGKGSTMPIRLKFFENLRGPPDSKFKPVDILLDV